MGILATWRWVHSFTRKFSSTAPTARRYLERPPAKAIDYPRREPCRIASAKANRGHRSIVLRSPVNVASREIVDRTHLARQEVTPTEQIVRPELVHHPREFVQSRQDTAVPVLAVPVGSAV